MDEKKTNIPMNVKDFFEAAKIGDIARVTSFLGESSIYNNSEALSIAAENGHLDLVKLLIPVSDPKSLSSWPLAAAAVGNHLEIVKLLISVSDPKVDESWILTKVAKRGLLEAVKLLAPVCDPKANHSSALFAAVSNGHLDVVAYLLPMSDGAGALASAAISGHMDIVKFLMTVQDPKENNSQSLAFAAKHEHPEIMKTLIPVSDVEKAVNFLIEDNFFEKIDPLISHLSPSAFQKIAKLGQEDENKDALDHMPIFRARLLDEQLKESIHSATTEPRLRGRI